MTENAFRCAVVTRDEEFRGVVSAVLNDPGRPRDLVLDMRANAGELDSEQLERLHAAEPEVILLDLGDDVAAGLRIIHSISDSLPGRQIIVAGAIVETQELLSIMRAGASEYLPKPVSDQDVTAALSRATRKARVVRTEDNRPVGQVFTVFSGKGGAGVTTFATNLAVRIAEQTHRKTLLLDFHRELGTAAVAMSVQPRYTFIDIIRNFHRMDEPLLNSYLERHDSGVFVLGSPIRAEDSEAMTAEHVRGLLGYLKENFEFVVVDLGHSLSTLRAAVLEESDKSILITAPELPTLRNTKDLLLNYGGSAGQGSAKLHLILNRFRADSEITIPQVEQALGVKVTATLARDDDRILHSLNAGRPIVLNGKSKYSKDVTTLCTDFVGSEFRNGAGRGVRSALSMFGRGRSKKAKKSNQQESA